MMVINDWFMDGPWLIEPVEPINGWSCFNPSINHSLITMNHFQPHQNHDAFQDSMKFWIFSNCSAKAVAGSFAVAFAAKALPELGSGSGSRGQKATIGSMVVYGGFCC